MKALSVFSRARTTSFLICLLVLSFVLFFVVDSVLFVHSYLYLDFSPRMVLGSPLQWYRFITYPLLSPQITYLLSISIFLLLSGSVIEPRLGRGRILAVVVGSFAISALAYTLLWVLGFDNSDALAGSGSILSGYAGAQFACWKRQRSTFSKAARIYTLLMFIWVIVEAFSFPPGFVAACFGFLFGLWAQRYQREQETAAITGSPDEAAHAQETHV